MPGKALAQWRTRVTRIDEAPLARRSFVQHLKKYAGGESDFDAAELIFAELVSNALRFGEVELSIDWVPPAVQLRVCDRGEAFSIEELDPPNLTGERGRGLFLVRRLAKRLTCERTDEGNAVLAVLPVTLGSLPV